MGSQETKWERMVTKEELPVFFREIAEKLEQGVDEDDALAALNDFYKLKISIKDEYGNVFVKCKAKTPETQPDLAAKTGEKPRYKDLKKQMKKSFKVIFNAVHENRMPSKEAVEAFVQESKIMISYPGYGDEYYGEYDQACQEFLLAYEQNDFAAFDDAVHKLDELKSHCHNKYK